MFPAEERLGGTSATKRRTAELEAGLLHVSHQQGPSLLEPCLLPARSGENMWMSVLACEDCSSLGKYTAIVETIVASHTVSEEETQHRVRRRR